MELISVIVPIYNAERYLSRCVESIIGQTWPDLEIILADDGSVDTSFDICLSYARRDPRVYPLRLKHRGVTAARKAAMSVSTGSIIAFADSDDWLEAQAIERMYTEMNRRHADIVVAGYMETGRGQASGKQSAVILDKIPAGVYSGEELQKDVYSKMLCYEPFFELGIRPYLWNKLYRREVIEPCVMLPDDHLTIGEDVLCVYPAILKAESVSFLSEAYYHYCIHEESAMRRFRNETEEVGNIRMQYWGWSRILKGTEWEELVWPQAERYLLHHFMVRAANHLERYMRLSKTSFLERMEPGSRMVLYGAGAFGTSLYDMYQRTGNGQVVGWCDRNYKKFQQMGYPVMSPEEALDLAFDYVVIAVLNQRITEQVKHRLVLGGVPELSIKWLNTEAIQKINLTDVIIWEDGQTGE